MRTEDVATNELDMLEGQLERILLAEAQNVRGRAELMHQFGGLRRQIAQLRHQVEQGRSHAEESRNRASSNGTSSNGKGRLTRSARDELADRLSLLETEMGLMLENIRTLTRNVLANGQAVHYIGRLLLERDEPAWQDLESMMTRFGEAPHD